MSRQTRTNRFSVAASRIIEEVGRPIQILSVDGYRDRPGVDLRCHQESLAKFLKEVYWDHFDILAYFDMAALPVPRKRESIAKSPKKFPRGYDYYPYYASPKAVQAEWDELMDMFPKRKRGNPSMSRVGEEFPVGPLQPIYWMALEWWEKHVGEGFTPSFAGGDDVTFAASEYNDADDMDEHDAGKNYNNADSRFLLGVLQFVEPRCQSSHASSMYERLRKLHKKYREDRAKREQESTE